MKHKNNAGYSLIEVVVAIAILALIIVPVSTGMVTGNAARSADLVVDRVSISILQKQGRGGFLCPVRLLHLFGSVHADELQTVLQHHAGVICQLQTGSLNSCVLALNTAGVIEAMEERRRIHGVTRDS